MKHPSEIVPTNEYSNYMMQNAQKRANLTNSWSLGDESDFPNHMIWIVHRLSGKDFP